ncbi:transcription factor bHLH162-like [Mangifera indica]|uniref:transcription factor bHLH162-like n=1 Tax=Mangifera indica TaxID=29780 RepID=UPI001CFA87E5|nr:transcription factor bHLH162-like [Mangifera indica]
MKAKMSDQSSKLDRKVIERNRRNHMKTLCFKLASLLPSQHTKTSKDMLSQQDQLDLAAAYIKQLRDRIEKLKEMREEATKSTKTSNSNITDTTNIGLRLPLVELREVGPTIEVVLITGLQKNFMLYEVISILEEEGAEVVNASFSTLGDKLFHSIHAQVKISRVGVETSRVCQRLQELVYS